jgi:hypothetical protein
MICGLLFAAQAERTDKRTQRDGIRDDAEASATKTGGVTPSLARLSWFLSEDGTLDLAGVKRFEFDDAGNAVIEVAPNGSFELDPVLSLHVAVRFSADGVLQTTAFKGIDHDGDAYLLTIRPIIGGAGIGIPLEYDGCATYVPFPSGDPYCKAVGDGCPTTKPVCDWVYVPGSGMTCVCQAPSE